MKWPIYPGYMTKSLFDFGLETFSCVIKTSWLYLHSQFSALLACYIYCVLFVSALLTCYIYCVLFVSAFVGMDQWCTGRWQNYCQGHWRRLVWWTDSTETVW